MPRIDDLLSRELDRAARPSEGAAGVFDGIERRRGRRIAVRRVQAASLAVVVLLATTGGVLILSQAFRSDGRPATPSPAGRLNGDIVFARIVKGEQHLWVSDTSGAERQFTTSFEDPSTSETYPDVSPDGRRVVFTASTPDGRVSLYTVDMAGGTVQAILDPSMIGTQPDWSPDGGSIAFAGYDGSDAGVFIVRSDGSDLRFVSPPSLFSAGDPSWTPDGSRIVFSASVGEGTDVGGEPFQMDLYSMRVDGTGLQRLTDTPGVQEQQADVSPDGRTIVFTSQIGAGDRTRAGLSTLSIDGGSPQLFLKPDGIHGSPSWSPDGELIVFEWYESGSSIYIIGRDGTGLTRLGSGSAPSWQPLSVPSGTSPQPQPTVSETPEPGRDIGLSFLVCHMSAIKGIDFLGDGAEGTAWVGTQLEAGRCVSEYEGDNIVAVDVTGDGLADSWAGPLAHCVSCSPFDITDLNGDGILELVVTAEFGSVTGYSLFSLQPAGAGGSFELQPVTVADPGNRQGGFPAGKPASLGVGGDEGFSGYVRCEGYPADPVIVYTQSYHPVEGAGSQTRTVDETRLMLGADGTLQVVGTNHYTEPTTSQQSYAFTGAACGVRFWPGS